MKGMETLVREYLLGKQEIGDYLEAIISDLREDANEYWLVDFAENESQATSDVQDCDMGIASLFPPSGNQGYVCNRNVLYLSITPSYVVMT